MATSKAAYKIWKSSRDAEAGFMVTPESAVMAGSKNSFIVTDTNGVVISGPLSIVSSGENIRQGGLFIHMNDFLAMIPSTIVTPIPTLVPFPPVAMVAHVTKTLPFIMAMLAV